MVTIPDAYAHCARLASEHYENFPVASWLLPKAARPHVAAIYAFARGADDLADEGSATADDRLIALDRWRGWLHAAARQEPIVDAGGHEAVFVALAETLRTEHLPIALFDDLISAFAQDVVVKRYDRWVDVLDYCRRSANPVGRLVLRVCGYRDERLDHASDCVCTALQLANFWQDLARDWTIGRLYVPRETWESAGARLEDFAPEALTPAWRRTLDVVVDRTQALFDEGRPVCDGVAGRLRYELRLTWLGGTRILARTRQGYAGGVHRRPSLGAGDAGPLLWHTLTWR